MATESFIKEFRVTRRNYKHWLKAFEKPSHAPIIKPKERIETVKGEDIRKFFGVEG